MKEENDCSVIFLYRSGCKKPFNVDLSLDDVYDSFYGLANEKKINKITKNADLKKQSKEKLLEIPFKTLFSYLEQVELISKRMNKLEQPKHQPWNFLCAAVSDYFIPMKDMTTHKIQASDAESGLKIELTSTPKMLGEWRKLAPNVGLISFKLETDFNILNKKVDSSFSKYGSSFIIGNLLDTRYDEITMCWKLGDGKGGRNVGWDMEKVVLKEHPEVQVIEELIVNHICKFINDKKSPKELKIPETPKISDQETRFLSMSTEIFNKFDVNKTGSLSKAEFTVLTQCIVKKAVISQELIDEGFTQMDENGDQKISLEEMQKSMRNDIYKFFETEASGRDFMRYMGL